MLNRQNSSSNSENLTFTNGFSFRSSDSTKKSPFKPPENAYVHNKTTTEHQIKKPQCLSASQRLEKKQETKQKLVGLLNKVGETDLAERVNVCGQKFGVISCGSHVISRKPKHSCNSRLCPYCAPKRSQRIQDKYLPLMNEFLNVKRSTPVHLVLTQSHRKTERLKDSRKRLMTAFKKVQKRHFWKNHFYGGVYAFEATKTDTGHHAHLHILAFRRRFFDISLLRSEWLEITGDSHVLRLDKITEIRTGLREVVKYVSKPLDIEKYAPKDLREMLELKGQRLFGAFGIFSRFCRNFDASDIAGADEESYSGYCEGDACPVCEKPLFETVMTDGELLEFTRKIETVRRI